MCQVCSDEWVPTGLYPSDSLHRLPNGCVCRIRIDKRLGESGIERYIDRYRCIAADPLGDELREKCGHTRADLADAWVLEASQGSKLWAQTRTKMITASRVADLLGVGYNDIELAWMHLAGKLHPVINNERAVQWGNDWEPVVRSGVCELGGYTCEEVGLCVSKHTPWLGGSPDGILTDKEGKRYILEIKCPFRYARKRACLPCEEGTWDLQPGYWHQVQTLMYITGIERALFVIWSPGHYHTQVILYDQPYVVGNMIPKLSRYVLPPEYK